jgi:hypothetical protein
MTETSDGSTYRQYELTPRKRAQFSQVGKDLIEDLVGTYSKERFRAEFSEDYFFGGDMLAVRFWTQILEGKTYAEEFEVCTDVPATWWQHLKSTLFYAHGMSRRRWIPRFLVARFPVRDKTLKSRIKLEGSYLYPQADFITAKAGPVTIRESVTIPEGPHYVPLDTPSRFASEHEIANAFFHDPAYATMGPPTPDMLLYWLARHGVNINQLVPRKML